MRDVKASSKFKRDLKRELKSPQNLNLEVTLDSFLKRLCADEELPRTSRDHILIGDFKGSRECHIKPDLLLIYKKVGLDEIHLIRIGSHSEIFN